MPGGKQGVFGIKMLSVVKLLARRRCLTVARRAGRGVAARWVWRRLVSHWGLGFGKPCWMRAVVMLDACSMALILLYVPTSFFPVW